MDNNAHEVPATRRPISCFAATLFVAAVMAAGLALSATPASAAPSRAPSAFVGTADCGDAGMFTFVVNSGNSQTTTFSPAFLSNTTNGRRAIFVPTELDLVFGGMSSGPVFKGNAQGSVTCSISGGTGEFALTGTVVGNIITLGR